MAELKNNATNSEFPINRIYRHFKGNLYYVNNVLIHTETREELVSYQALYPPYGMFARPKEMFIEEISTTKEGNITGQNRRFQLFDPSK